MGFEAWLTLAVVFGVLVALVWNLGPPDLLFVGATGVLALFGVISPSEAFSGFANPGVVTVAVLFVVAAGLRETGVLDYLGHWVLGNVATEKSVLGRLAALVLPLSAFLNNTPIVAMLMPVVMDWCRRHQISTSKLLIPLSYLAILGGTCTLIGTSTNLVVNGLMIRSHQEMQDTARTTADPTDQRFADELRGMHLFEITLIGVPYALIGLAYLFLVGRRLVPDRKELFEQLGSTRREYLLEMLVEPGCRLVGRPVEEAGLRQLPGLFLIEIDRAGMIIAPVSPEILIQANDRLIFTGVVGSIVELEKIPGLVPTADATYEVTPGGKRNRQFTEAVISPSSPLIGKTIRSADFRATYNAAVVAVHRNGGRLTNKVGDIELRPGDTLLLQTTPHFHRAHRNNADFYLVSEIPDWRPLRRDRAWIALALFAVLIVLMSGGWVEISVAGTLTAALMVALGCISVGDARKSVDWQVLITIAAAFGVGAALQNSGAAAALAGGLVEMTKPFGPLAALAGLYLLCSLLTELITNNAAAVLLFPFCIETARLYGTSPRPFLIALILAASASFATPIGYQTNMMVYGPGGYRFTDFLRAGIPLNLILWATAVLLIPVFWPW